MTSDVPVLIRENGSANVPPRCVGFSIQPASGSDENFLYGLDDDPSIQMNAGEGGQNFGFLPLEYGYKKQVKINVSFLGGGTSPGCLIIFTTHQDDLRNC
jgi:hypothetical protein